MSTAEGSLAALIEELAAGRVHADNPSDQANADEILVALLQAQAGARTDVPSAVVPQQPPEWAEEQARLVGSLRKMLEAREAEILALRSGGEQAAFRRFIGGFVRAHQAADNARASNTLQEGAIDLVRDLLTDALDACGVEQFRPSLGADYRREEGVADNPEVQEASDGQPPYAITAVLAAGYRRETPGGFEILIPAKVRVASPAQPKDK